MINFFIEHTIESTFYFLSIAIIISTLEYIYIFRNFKGKIFLSQKLAVAINPIYKKSSLKLIFNDKLFLWVLWIKIFSTLILLLVIPKSFVWSFFITILLISSLVVNFRDVLSKEGSDQIQLIVLIALFLSTQFWASDLIVFYGILFIAIHSVLSYFTSGISKLFSLPWRKGEAFYQIMNTVSFGDKKVAQLFHQRSTLGIITCWIVIVFECIFPFVFIMPTEILIIFLSIAFLFHIANAIIMGLNVFSWAFLATYPSIIYINQAIMN
jgi:hypothetical protein